ncbi:hypothetical protein, partial [Sphingobium sp.]|uniref:hypothetical protein n=1 Tax=Sphingobium sp. TaxID=1912891 RepID=UPI00257E80FB
QQSRPERQRSTFSALFQNHRAAPANPFLHGLSHVLPSDVDPSLPLKAVVRLPENGHDFQLRAEHSASEKLDAPESPLRRANEIVEVPDAEPAWQLRAQTPSFSNSQ